MLEIPETRNVSKELRKEIRGTAITNVGGNFTDHKFTFYYGDPEEYKNYLVNKKVTDIIDRNYYVEIEIEDYKLIMRDGANIRYYKDRKDLPEKSKLLLEFNDGSFLNVTTAMYSAINVFSKNENYDDEYYNLELTRVGVLDKEFTFDYFKSLINDETAKLSLKAFLATGQRILGIGNGSLQDILYNAKMHPKRKINTLNERELKDLYETAIKTIKTMVKQGGRDTEKDIYGQNGGYKTILSKNTYKNKCHHCYSEIKKESYLGGTIYYCPNCQKL